MKNILRILWDDAKHLFSNPVVIIVTVGIIVLPSLYAWFNIIANWDPYANTKHLKVAVANCDQGITPREIYDRLGIFRDEAELAMDFDKDIFNIGDELIDHLQENDQISWQFVSGEAALSGVEDGTYYAALIIPEGFSQDFLTFLDEKVSHPKLQYYVNAKKNAIATKITDAVVSKIKTQVDDAFVNQISETVGIVLNDAAVELEKNTTDDGSSVELLQEISNQLLDLQDTTKILNDSLIATQSTVRVLKDTLDYAQEDLQQLAKDSQSMVDLVETSRAMAEIMESSCDQTMDATDQMTMLLRKQVKRTEAALDLEDRTTMLDDAIQYTKRFSAFLNRIFPKEIFPPAEETNLAMLKKIADLRDKVEQLSEDLEELQTDLRDYGKFTEKNLKKISRDLDQIDIAAEDVQQYYKTDMKPALSENADNLCNALAKIPQATKRSIGLLEELEVTLDHMDVLLSNQIDSYDSVQRLLGKSKDEVDEMITTIHQVKDRDRLDNLLSLMKNDPETFAEFISSPVDIETNTMYSIENYGSAMTPFYTILSLWVGALIACTVISPRVTNVQFVKCRLYQQYFGRGFTFLMIGICQGIVVSLGDLFLLKIQCVSPPLFVVTCLISSIVFSTIIFTLTIVLGNVGKAIAVILLVLQVAGSGGTFPMEVLPGFFGSINTYLPFSYAINALRECVAGFYGNLYWRNIGAILCYIPPFIVLGLLTWQKVYRANEYFRKKLEQTDIIG